MGNDAIIGHDGKPRCSWAGATDTALGRYHDEVWGTRTYDESAMFEALTLGVFEVGLSWSIVFGEREAFRRAFHDFDVAKVAAMTDRDVDRLAQDASIIRNRGKIQATIDNAPRDEIRVAEAWRARQVPRDRPQACTALARGPPYVDATCRSVRQAVEVSGVPLRRDHECVRLHAERRRGQRPHPWVLPSDRLPPGTSPRRRPRRTWCNLCAALAVDVND